MVAVAILAAYAVVPGQVLQLVEEGVNEGNQSALLLEGGLDQAGIAERLVLGSSPERLKCGTAEKGRPERSELATLSAVATTDVFASSVSDAFIDSYNQESRNSTK